MSPDPELEGWYLSMPVRSGLYLQAKYLQQSFNWSLLYVRQIIDFLVLAKYLFSEVEPLIEWSFFIFVVSRRSWLVVETTY